MSQQLQQTSYEDTVEGALAKISQLAEQRTPNVMQPTPDGVYRITGGNMQLLEQRISNQQPQVPQYNFSEQILDTKSSTSIIGEAIGAGLSGTVYGLASGFLPGMASMSPGLITAAAGWAIGKYLLKSGFGHSIARGVMIAGITTFVAPMVSGIAGGLTQAAGV